MRRNHLHQVCISAKPLRPRYSYLRILSVPHGYRWLAQVGLRLKLQVGRLIGRRVQPVWIQRELMHSSGPGSVTVAEAHHHRSIAQARHYLFSTLRLSNFLKRSLHVSEKCFGNYREAHWIFSNSYFRSLQKNGTYPDSISWMNIPKLYQSSANPHPWRASISGEMYLIDPQKEFVLILIVTPTFANPKSVSLACPSWSRTTLSDLRSL